MHEYPAKKYSPIKLQDLEGRQTTLYSFKVSAFYFGKIFKIKTNHSFFTFSSKTILAIFFLFSVASIKNTLYTNFYLIHLFVLLIFLLYYSLEHLT